MQKQLKLLLGTASPRRQSLLQEMGFSFKKVTIDCEEVYPKDLAPSKVAGYLAELKAGCFRELQSNEVLLTADTIVALEDEILGKPINAAEAENMLSSLSGKKHQVYTSFSLKTNDSSKTFTDFAEVEFLDISPEEIEYYITCCQPFDKAGSYGIQEWLGMTKIKSLQGSYYTIMGLPCHLVYSKLVQLGFTFSK